MAGRELADTIDSFEESKPQVSLDHPNDAPVAFGLVGVVDGELIQLVTIAALRDRQAWFEELGLSPDFVDDIDADYGVALIDEAGVVTLVGPNLEYAAEAAENLHTYGRLTDDRVGSVGENPDAKTLFTVSAQSIEGEITDIDPEATPAERRVLLEVYGLMDPKGYLTDGSMGWTWVTPDGVAVAAGHGPDAIHHILHTFFGAKGWYEQYPFPLSEII